MRKIALTVLLVSSLASCATPERNFPVAQCQKRPEGYALIMHGMRDNMTHSFLAFVVKPSYQAQLELLVPRVTGKVDGREAVHLARESQKFSGDIEFSTGTAVVALTTGANAAPWAWNGRYRLGQCTE